VGEKTVFGLGATFGTVDVDPGTDMTYEQVNARITWDPSDYFYANVSGGVEVRQFVDSGASDRVSPIFALSLGSQPFEQTTIGISAARSVSASPFSDQITENTSVSANLRQRILDRWFFSISGGYRVTAHESASASVPVAREDRGTFVRLGLSTTWQERGTFQVFFSQSRNDSDAAGFGYDSTQVGLDIGYRY